MQCAVQEVCKTATAGRAGKVGGFWPGLGFFLGCSGGRAGLGSLESTSSVGFSKLLHGRKHNTWWKSCGSVCATLFYRVQHCKIFHGCDALSGASFLRI